MTSNMAITAIPNELVMAITDILPTRDLSVLSRTNTSLNQLLTPILYGRARQHHLDFCIIHDLPTSLRALLRLPNTHFGITSNLRVNTPIWPLHYAALNCSPSLVSTIIALGAPVDDAAATPHRTTTLQHAVYSRNTTTASIVLASGANIDRYSTITCHPPLELACSLHDSDMAHLLIDHGAHPSAGALAHATSSSLITVMQRQLDLGVSVNARHECFTGRGRLTALQRLCVWATDEAAGAARVLLRAGADVHVCPGETMAPLFCCVVRRDVELARVLVLYSADPGMVVEGRTMVELSELCDSWEMVAVLKGTVVGE